MSDAGLFSRGTPVDTRPAAAAAAAAADDATRFRTTSSSGGNLTSRGLGPSKSTGHPASSSSSSEHRTPADRSHLSQLPNRHPLALSRSNSQGTSSTNGADPVFTPPASGGRLSPGNGSAHDSSQESQLLQLSQIAAAQARIPEDAADMAAAASRKRMADGMVKHTRDRSNVSPGQMVGHSRNTSTVSVASTAGSRIGEVPSWLPPTTRAISPVLTHLQLSAELRARLSYAMVKVNHGWQAHSIDQVETLASHAASPASSASTVHLRHESSSASPQLSAVSHRGSNNTTPATGPHHQYSSGRPGDAQWRDSPQSTSRGSSASPVKASHGLAPPVSIQPSQPLGNPRREPNPRHAPAFLSSAHHTSPRAGLHTSPYLAPGRQHRPAMTEAMLVSPHTNVREQDAIESLLFMSSPGNSANLKHAFPSSASQPLPAAHAPSHPRTALPTSQPRKSLPSGRPAPHHARSQSQTTKRVGFEKSPSAMDIDDPPGYAGSPMSVSRGTPRRRINGGGSSHVVEVHARLKHMPASAGLTVSSKPRPVLGDDEIDRMLDRAVAAAEQADDSESDGEICLPVSGPGRVRRDGAGVVGV